MATGGGKQLTFRTARAQRTVRPLKRTSDKSPPTEHMGMLLVKWVTKIGQVGMVVVGRKSLIHQISSTTEFNKWKWERGRSISPNGKGPAHIPNWQGGRSTSLTGKGPFHTPNWEGAGPYPQRKMGHHRTKTGLRLSHPPPMHRKLKKNPGLEEKTCEKGQNSGPTIC